MVPVKAVPQSVQQAAWRTASAVKPPLVTAPTMAFVSDGFDDVRSPPPEAVRTPGLTMTGGEDLPAPPKVRPDDTSSRRRNCRSRRESKRTVAQSRKQSRRANVYHGAAAESTQTCVLRVCSKGAKGCHAWRGNDEHSSLLGITEASTKKRNKQEIRFSVNKVMGSIMKKDQKHSVVDR